jgi:hypothetical protein
MTFSDKTLELFQQLLDDVSIPAKAPNFEELCSIVGTAKRELADARDGVEDA